VNHDGHSPPRCPVLVAVRASSPAPSRAQPFLDADHWAQGYFPERAWAVAIPTLLFTAAVALGGLVVGAILLKSAAAKKRK
jgi:hypothetical protein